MSEVLARAELREQIDRFLRREIEARTLSGWAFDRFYAAEEGQILFEEGAAEQIGEVLDELMFSDSPPFELDDEHARALQQRLL